MDLSRLDPDAVRSIQRLDTRGFEAYLVGGCVRDLLLDRDPHDFDIATEARPQQVKRAFPRNCRIIGRRFKLAHLHFNSNQNILEVATFRSSPVPESETGDEDADVDADVDGDDEGNDTPYEDPVDYETAPELAGDPDADDADDADLLILRDNEFGTVEEDAVRRDFTINALFLDPIADEILDYVGGMQDVEDQVIRTIGDPVTRFREDPVRILRAAKFAGRLGFHLDGPTGEAMRETVEDLRRAAPPRILEEIQRLLRAGHALPSFQILRDVGGLAVLLPRVDEYLQAADEDERYRFWRTLDVLDNHIHNGNTPSNAVLLGCLFLRPILRRHEEMGNRSPTTAAEAIVGPLAQELRLPRRDAGALKRICSVHGRFTASGRRRFRLASFLQDTHLPEALELFELTCFATGEHFDDLERWRELGAGEHTQAEPAEEDPVSPSAGRTSSSSRSGARSGSRQASVKAKKATGKKTTGKKTAGKKTGGRKTAAAERKRSARKKSDEKTRAEKTKKKEEEVQVLEPEAYDLSAFDRELAPREVPRFDTIVETNQGNKKRRRAQPAETDSYKPPPPPGGDDPAPPPPPVTDDVFGDW